MSDESHAEIVAGILEEWRKIPKISAPVLDVAIEISFLQKPFDFEKHPVSSPLASQMQTQMTALHAVARRIREVIEEDPSIEDFKFTEGAEVLVLDDLADAGIRRAMGLEYLYQDYLNSSRKSPFE